MPATLARAPAVDLASALLDYLKGRLAVDDLEYRERAVPGYGVGAGPNPA